MPKEFEDFDEPANFHKYVKRAKDADARNFVLEFSHDKARCAFDIDETDLKTVLENEVTLDSFTLCRTGIDKYAATD